MNWRKWLKKGFTLVELLVVVGIIALLVAILMPALARARKSALIGSCSANCRNQVWGSMAYATDWKNVLPNRSHWCACTTQDQISWAGPCWGDTLSRPDGKVTGGGGGPDESGNNLNKWSRLPVIGFDELTALPPTPDFWGARAPGGMGYVFRDYLKSDFDVIFCTDPYWEKSQWVERPSTFGSIASLFTGGGHTGPGYFYGAHRQSPPGCVGRNDPLGQAQGSCNREWGGQRCSWLTCGVSPDGTAQFHLPSQDRSFDTPRFGGDPGTQMMTADWNRQSIQNANTSSGSTEPYPSSGYTAEICWLGNHLNTASFGKWQILHCDFPSQPNEEDLNEDQIWAGINVGRLDSKTSFVQFSDAKVQWCHTQVLWAMW